MATRCIDNKTDFELITVNTSDKQINDIANEYIQARHLNVVQSVGFNTLLLHISNNVPMYDLDVNNNPDYSNIDRLNYYFNIYAQLCSICNILPDLTGYSIFANIPYDTLKEWRDGQVRSTTHTHIVKKWNQYCKITCVAEAGRGNVGAIYVSKAIHGLSDSAPQATYTQNNLYINAPATRDAIAAEFGALLTDNLSQ